MTEAEAKEQLALAYKIIGRLGLDDHTYTHLSMRHPADPDSFLIHHFGLRFEEVTAQEIIHVGFDGKVRGEGQKGYNKTGYYLHGYLLQNRQDLNVVFHVHEPAMVAVSACKEGLLPLSQWALHFYNRVAYYDYDSLALDGRQAQDLVRAMKGKRVAFLRNHGIITAGRDVQEALFYLYHLHMACKTQCLALSMGQELVLPAPDVCEKAAQDLLSFEENLGHRDWQAWVRRLN